MVSKSKRRRLAAEKRNNQQTRAVQPMVVVTRSQPSTRRKRVVAPRQQVAARGNPNRTTLSGVELLGTTLIEAKTQVGESLLEYVINPQNLPGTRLTRMAQLWVRWRPLQLKIEAVTNAGFLSGGGYSVGWSADPTERLGPASTDNVRHVIMLSSQNQVWFGNTSTTLLVLPTEMSSKWYTFRGTVTESSHGVVLAVLTGPIVSKTTSITWKLHWKIEFDGPDAPAESEENSIDPAPGWENIFTDSVSDWLNGKYLTFKEKEGGTVVPWVNLKSNVIYQTTENTHIPFFTPGGPELECNWFSRMKGSEEYSNALVLHLTEADAIDYQKTGDKTKLVSFVKAGNYCRPSRPKLVAYRVVSSNIALTNKSDRDSPLVSPRKQTLASEVETLRGQVREISDMLAHLVTFNRLNVKPSSYVDNRTLRRRRRRVEEFDDEETHQEETPDGDESQTGDEEQPGLIASIVNSLSA